jgi:archaellum component FlaC
MDIKNKIEQLKNDLKVLDPIVEKRFKTSKELNDYVEKNKDAYQKANDIYKQIQQLEYELMTPKEKEKYEKGMLFLELKAKGEPFDLSEFEDLNE